MRCLAIALLAGIGVLAGVSPALAQNQDADEDAASATLTIINPPSEISGVAIKRVTVSLDQSPFGGCDLGSAKARAVCVKPREIDPGPHVIEIIFDPLTSRFFKGSLSFTAGARGPWVLDLAKMAGGAPDSEALSVTAKLAPVEGCAPALERIAALPSCTAAGLEAVVRAFGEAASQCRRRDVSLADAQVGEALVNSLVVHFFLDIEQCYSADQLKKLPHRITGRYIPTDTWPPVWPPYSITLPSWRWAREVLPEIRRRDRDAAAILDKTLKVMPQMFTRFEVVDGVIDAYLKGDPGPVLRAAEQHWSLDPATSEGHRTLLILTDPEFFFERRYDEFAAGKAAADPALACGASEWQTIHLIDYFTAKQEISPAAWQAVSAMMGREPPDGDYTPCRPAFDPQTKSTVSVEERLRRLVALDCSEKRPPGKRGEWLKQILSRDSDRMAGVDFDLRHQLKDEFAGCLAKP